MEKFYGIFGQDRCDGRLELLRVSEGQLVVIALSQRTPSVYGKGVYVGKRHCGKETVNVRRSLICDDSDLSPLFRVDSHYSPFIQSIVNIPLLDLLLTSHDVRSD